MAVQKTNAARLLDAAGIPYTLVPYEVDEEHLEASHVAEQLGEDLDRVFKTLVLRGDRNGLFVCVMPGSLEVDLRVAARISGNKNCAMIHVKELLPLTGYIFYHKCVKRDGSFDTFPENGNPKACAQRKHFGL